MLSSPLEDTRGEIRQLRFHSFCEKVEVIPELGNLLTTCSVRVLRCHHQPDCPSHDEMGCLIGNISESDYTFAFNHKNLHVRKYWLSVLCNYIFLLECICGRFIILFKIQLLEGNFDWNHITIVTSFIENAQFS